MARGDRYKTFLTYLQSKLDKANALLGVVRVEGEIEIPSSLEEELRTAESQKATAVKKFSESHDEEATVSILSEAGDRMIKVVYEALRLCLLSPVQMVRDELKSFKGDEDLAALHIPNYNEHSENFQKIEELLDDWTLRGKRLEQDQVGRLRKQLEDFFKAIEIGKPKIAAVKARREEEKREKEEEKKERKKDRRISWIGIWVGVAIAAAGFVNACIPETSSQQAAQPEATASAAGP